MHNNVRLLNKSDFCNRGFNKNNGEYEFEKAKFLFQFEFDPVAQKDALELLSKSAKKGYKKAFELIDEIKKNHLYENTRRLF